MTASPCTGLTEAQRAEVETLAAVLTSAQIADFLGIGRSTFYRLLERDPELAGRYKRGKARAVGAVAQSLVTKARAGNVTAMIFFLKTQGGWRETVEVAVPQETSAIDLSGLSDETLGELMAVLQKAGTAEGAAIELEQDRADGPWSVA
jgi:hypothetical protein